MANTFNLGNGNWAQKTEKVLAYNAENNNYKPLPFDFDRASTATRVNKQGLIETVGIDEPRIDFLNNTKGHLLLEPQRQNLVPYSEDINNSAWNKISATITDNVAISPDGTQNADLFVPNSSGGQIYDGLGSKAASAITYTVSMYVKSSGLNSIRFYLHGASNANRGDATFDLENVTSSSSNVGAFTNTSASISSVGNDWFRCVLTTTSDTSALIQLVIRFDGTTDDVSGLNIWGIQTEEGSYATSYIPTSGSAVTRVDDTFNQYGWQSKGILGASAGTLFLDLRNCFSKDDTEIVYQFVDSSENPIFRLYFEQSPECSIFSVYNNINSEFVKQNFTLTSSPKIAIVYDGTSRLDIFGNGQKLTKTGGNLTSNASVDGFEDALSDNFNSTSFNEIKLYNTALTDAELIALTS